MTHGRLEHTLTQQTEHVGSARFNLFALLKGASLVSVQQAGKSPLGGIRVWLAS